MSAAVAGGPETPYTGLVKHVIANDARTRRTMKLLLTVAMIVVVPVALVAVVAALLGPAAAAVTGGVPLGSAALTTAAWQLRRPTRNAPPPADQKPE
jgi:hypothetical protein